MQTNVVYMTAGDIDEAKTIASALVKERLAACVNILPGMESFYQWRGEVENEQEIVLIAKTKTILMPRLTERVKELHSYDVPCIVSFPITGGAPDFIKWIASETI